MKKMPKKHKKKGFKRVKMNIRFSKIPVNVPIHMVFDGLKSTRTRKIFDGRFIYLKAFFDFGYRGKREFELCVPYDKFIQAAMRLSLKKQRWIRDIKTVVVFYKREFGFIDIEEVLPWKNTVSDGKDI